MKRVVGPNPSEETQKHAPTSSSAPPPELQNAPALATTPRRGQPLPSELMEILVPSLRVGAIAGACGVFTGAAAGIIRSAPVAFFSVIAGAQWFTLGTSYYAARLAGLKYFGQGDPTPKDMVKASTVAGGVAGTLGGLLRGPRNIIPGILMFSLFGAGGQAIVNWREAKTPKAQSKPSSSGWWSRWSPITELSDQDYVNILEEKLLRVEAEIALIDDRIVAVRESDNQTKQDGSLENSAGTPPSPSNA